MLAILVFSASTTSFSQSFQDRLDDFQDDMLFQREHDRMMRELELDNDRMMRELERGLRQSPAPSDWKYIGETISGKRFLIKTSTLKKLANGSINFVFLERSDKPMYHKEIIYFYSRTTAEINCSNRSMVYRSAELFSRVSNLVGTINYSPEPLQIQPNTMNNKMAAFIC